jgi:hypothetical protein
MKPHLQEETIAPRVKCKSGGFMTFFSSKSLLPSRKYLEMFNVHPD